MAKIAIGVGVTLVILLTVVVGYNMTDSNPQRIPQPRALDKLHFAPDTLDLGAFKWGEETDFLLELVNTGETQVTLFSVSGNCDCTTNDLPVEDDLRTIPPGGTYPVQFHLDMGGSAGQKEVTITAVTMSGQRIEANVTALVEATWSLEQHGEMWDFGMWQIGGVQDPLPVWSIVFRSETETLTDIIPSQSWVGVERLPLPDGSATQVQLSFQPVGIEPGHHTAYVEFRTDSQYMPVLYRSMRVAIARALLPSPDPGVLKVDEELTFKFRGNEGDFVPIRAFTLPGGSGLEAEIVEGNVLVRRVAEPPDKEPIRLDVTAEDDRTGWVEVVVPDAFDFLP